MCLIDTDLDATAIYSKKSALTRKLTSVVAASVPNPNSGRELPALARQAGLKDIRTETFAIASPYEFLRALEINPRYLQALIWYGLFYLQWVAGREEEGIDQVRQAVECDPLSGYAKGMLAVAYADAGKLDQALRTAHAGVELDPDSLLTRWLLQVILRLLGRYPESIVAGEACLAISGRHPWSVASLGLAYADWGRTSEAKALYMELQWRAKREYVQPIALAWAASAMEDQGAAIQFAQEAYQRRDPTMIAAKRFSEMARLRKDPNFQKIITAVGLR